MRLCWIPLLLVLFVVVGALAYIVTLYNGLISVKNNVDKAWANSDVLLKGCMQYEGETLQRVTAARAAYASAATVD